MRRTGSFRWYATDLVAGTEEATAFELVRQPDASLAEVLPQLHAATEVLARVVDAAGPQERGFHPWGVADASGVAGMGCAELLLHAGDVAEDQGLDWTPPPALAAAVRARIFPWAPDDADPWTALRWATGRGELPGSAPVTSWRWHCAPLTDWDGTRPA